MDELVRYEFAFVRRNPVRTIQSVFRSILIAYSHAQRAQSPFRNETEKYKRHLKDYHFPLRIFIDTEAHFSTLPFAVCQTEREYISRYTYFGTVVVYSTIQTRLNSYQILASRSQEKMKINYFVIIPVCQHLLPII